MLIFLCLQCHSALFNRNSIPHNILSIRLFDLNLSCSNPHPITSLAPLEFFSALANPVQAIPIQPICRKARGVTSWVLQGRTLYRRPWWVQRPAAMELTDLPAKPLCPHASRQGEAINDAAVLGRRSRIQRHCVLDSLALRKALKRLPPGAFRRGYLSSHSIAVAVAHSISHSPPARLLSFPHPFIPQPSFVLPPPQSPYFLLLPLARLPWDRFPPGLLNRLCQLHVACFAILGLFARGVR